MKTARRKQDETRPPLQLSLKQAGHEVKAASSSYLRRFPGRTWQLTSKQPTLGTQGGDSSRPLAGVLYAERYAQTVAASLGRRAFRPNRYDNRESRRSRLHERREAQKAAKLLDVAGASGKLGRDALVRVDDGVVGDGDRAEAVQLQLLIGQRSVVDTVSVEFK